MDFLRKDEPVNQGVGQAAGAGQHHHADTGGKKSDKNKLMRITSVVLLFSVTILVVALLLSLVFGAPKSEDKYVDGSKLQAVFLNGGQVYFGNITTLNSKYLSMDHIYYLRVNQTVQPKNNQQSNNDVSLVKLGCELHGPEDQMVINRDQVVFWENLKTDGQVAKAVAAYVKQNPNGQQCGSTTNNSSSSDSSSSSNSSSANQ